MDAHFSQESGSHDTPRRQPSPSSPRQQSNASVPDLSRPRPGWYRSSHSVGAEQTCVEVAMCETVVLLRDSKDPAGPVLRFSRREWEAFLLAARDGEFELPEVSKGTKS